MTINIDSVMKIDKNLSSSLSRTMQIQGESFNDAELDLDSDDSNDPNSEYFHYVFQINKKLCTI